MENENPFHPVDLLFAEKLLRPFPDATGNASIFLAYMLAAARDGHLLCLLESNRIVPSLGAEWDAKVVAGARELPQSLLQEAIVHKECRWYLRRNWECEARFLKHFKRLSESAPTITIPLEAIQKQITTLQPEQREAICRAATQSVSLICGGPGTGKTFTAAFLIKVFSQLLDGEVAAAAPTGKAAANLRAMLGEAKTLHSLLRKERLPFDLLLVDEASMIDAELMARLFASLKKGARLVLVGDIYQLPPVESGNFFADLTQKKNHVCELKRCLRTEHIELLDMADQVKAGKPIAFSPLPEVKVLVNTIAERLCLEEGIMNCDRFRVLSPLRQGPYGVDTLNQLLYREHVKRCTKKPLSVPIMITVNHPSLDLFNGEIGFLVKEEKCAYFPNEKRVAEYLLPPYEYAYLLTVHKSQGSEYDAVWILLPEGSEVFGKQMLYTAITRAKKEVEILSNELVMNAIIVKQSCRLSGLSSFKQVV